MKIGRPEARGGEYRVCIESGDRPSALWYRVDPAFSGFLTDSSDAPLVALLIPAMARGEDIHLDGVVSDRLYRSLSYYQSLLQAVIPSLRQIRIHPRELQARRGKPRGVATGFSGGIDSFCVLADHYYSGIEPKVTHLLFNNVGSHGADASKADAVFESKSARAEAVAQRIGLPLIKVDSNLDAFYGVPLTFQQTHTPRNASVALLLQGGVGHYLYASTYHLRDEFLGPTYDMAYTDSTALPLLCTETLTADSVGGRYTRVEKTLRVASIAESHVSLDVCTQPVQERNCSKCFKCVRTLLALDIVGMLPRYAAAFDLNLYRKNRAYLIGMALNSADPVLKEIVLSAKVRGFRFPLSSRFAGLPEPLKVPLRVARDAAKAMLRGR
jgi:hypothetical protein